MRGPVKPPSTHAAAPRRRRRNQTRLVLPTGTLDLDRLQGVVVDWLVPALVDNFLKLRAETDASDSDRTTEALSRGVEAVPAANQC